MINHENTSISNFALNGVSGAKTSNKLGARVRVQTQAPASTGGPGPHAKRERRMGLANGKNSQKSFRHGKTKTSKTQNSKTRAPAKTGKSRDKEFEEKYGDYKTLVGSAFVPVTGDNWTPNEDPIEIHSDGDDHDNAKEETLKCCNETDCCIQGHRHFVKTPPLDGAARRLRQTGDREKRDTKPRGPTLKNYPVCEILRAIDCPKGKHAHTSDQNYVAWYTRQLPSCIHCYANHSPEDPCFEDDQGYIEDPEARAYASMTCGPHPDTPRPRSEPTYTFDNFKEQSYPEREKKEITFIVEESVDSGIALSPKINPIDHIQIEAITPLEEKIVMLPAGADIKRTIYQNINLLDQVELTGSFLTVREPQMHNISDVIDTIPFTPIGYSVYGNEMSTIRGEVQKHLHKEERLLFYSTGMEPVFDKNNKISISRPIRSMSLLWQKIGVAILGTTVNCRRNVMYASESPEMTILMRSPEDQLRVGWISKYFWDSKYKPNDSIMLDVVREMQYSECRIGPVFVDLLRWLLLNGEVGKRVPVMLTRDGEFRDTMLPFIVQIAIDQYPHHAELLGTDYQAVQDTFAYAHQVLCATAVKARSMRPISLLPRPLFGKSTAQTTVPSGGECRQSTQ